jgi:hypothetical protein
VTARSQRRRYALDVAILVFFAGAVVLELTGGFYSEPFGIRLSARRPDRPLLVAVVLAVIRWRWLPSGEFLARPLDVYRRAFQRLYLGSADASPEERSRRTDALAVLGLLALAALALQAQLRQMMSVPDLGDPLFSIWRMSWVYQQMQGDPRALFDANIFHPLPLTLTLSDSMLLPAVVAAPFFAAGLHPVLVYNMLLLASFPATGIATYFLVARVTRSAPAAFAGALFYMFHPYRFEHFSHFELLMTMWMPLALLAMIRFGETLRWTWAIAAAIVLAAQLYSSMYYGVYFPFYAAAVVGVLAVLQRWPWRRLIGPAVLSGAVALALAAPLSRPYLAAQTIKGDREAFAVYFYSADLSDFLRPHPRLAMHKERWLADKNPERALFPGLTPLVLSAVALVPPLGPVRVAFAAGVGVGYDMTRGLKGVLYPTLYRLFPPIRGMRVPARFSVILGLSLAVLAAFGVRRLLSRWSGWPRRLAFAAILGLMAVDLRPALELRPVWPDAPRIYADLAGRSDVVLAEFPFEQRDPWVTHELPFMYFSTWHGHQMVNGYSGFIPDSHVALVKLARDFPDPASMTALRTRGVTHVTVNCEMRGGDSCKEFLDRLDQRPELKLIKIAHWKGWPTRLYEFK